MIHTSFYCRHRLRLEMFQHLQQPHQPPCQPPFHVHHQIFIRYLRDHVGHLIGHLVNIHDQHHNLSNIISISIMNRQCLISKVFRRYLHSPGLHQSTRLLVTSESLDSQDFFKYHFSIWISSGFYFTFISRFRFSVIFISLSFLEKSERENISFHFLIFPNPLLLETASLSCSIFFIVFEEKQESWIRKQRNLSAAHFSSSSSE